MTEQPVKVRYSESDLNRDLLSVTGFFSVLIHATLILAVTFEFPEIASQINRDNTLEVVLLSRNNNQDVEDADLVSSANNLGGGDDDLEGATNEEWKPTNPSPIQTIEKKANQTLITQVTPDKFVTATESTISLPELSPAKTQLQTNIRNTGEDLVNVDEQKSERQRILARYKKAREEYAKRPKKKFHSPTTKESGAAVYISNWKKKVERVGNSTMPIEIRANQLSGSLMLTLEIRRNGMIEKIEILSSSRNKLLDESALRIIREAAPFETFPDNDYFRGQDILVITRMIHFLPESGFTSTAAGG